MTNINMTNSIVLHQKPILHTSTITYSTVLHFAFLRAIAILSLNFPFSLLLENGSLESQIIPEIYKIKLNQSLYL